MFLYDACLTCKAASIAAQTRNSQLRVLPDSPNFSTTKTRVHSKKRRVGRRVAADSKFRVSGRVFAENGLGQKTDSRQWTTLPLSAAWVFAESVFRYEDPATSKQTMVRVFRRGLAVRFSEKRTCHFSGEVDVSFQKTEQKTECCPSRGTRNHRPFRKTDSGVRNGRCKDPVSHCTSQRTWRSAKFSAMGSDGGGLKQRGDHAVRD